jgi:hypothetical protein
VDECAIDGCYEEVVDSESSLCEEHEVMQWEEVWPDFHDEGEVW